MVLKSSTLLGKIQTEQHSEQHRASLLDKDNKERIHSVSYSSFQWISTNDSNTNLHVLLMKNNQLKIQATINYDRHRVHSALVRTLLAESDKTLTQMDQDK